MILSDDHSAEEHRARVNELVSGWTEELGQTFVDEGRQTDEDDITIDTWTELDDPMIQIDLIEDKQAGCCYLSVVADDEGVRDRLRQQFERHLDVRSPSELRETVQALGERDPAAYVRLAIGSPAAFDDDTYQVIAAGLRFPNSEVRAQAATAAALLHWPPFARDAAEVLTTERDEGVRRLLLATKQFAESEGS